MPTKTKATKKQVVDAAARKHGVPPWLLWGIFGAESTWGTNGSNYFGLIFPEYNGRKVKSTTNVAEDADIAAELLARLNKEHGGWAGAVTAYSGGSYNISHPKQLSGQGATQSHELVSFDPLGTAGELLEGASGLDPFGLGSGLTEDVLGGAANILPDPLSGIAEFLKNISAFFKGFAELVLTPEGWLRLAKLVGGSILVLWGLKIVIRESTGTDVVKKGSGVIKKGVETAAAVATVK